MFSKLGGIIICGLIRQSPKKSSFVFQALTSRMLLWKYCPDCIAEDQHPPSSALQLQRECPGKTFNTGNPIDMVTLRKVVWLPKWEVSSSTYSFKHLGSYVCLTFSKVLNRICTFRCLILKNICYWKFHVTSLFKNIVWPQTSNWLHLS